MPTEPEGTANLIEQRTARLADAKSRYEVAEALVMKLDLQVCRLENVLEQTANNKMFAEQRAEQLEAKIAELERDAKRYRWLRRQCVDWGFSGRYRSSEPLDEAIDAATDAALATDAGSEHE